MPLHQCPGGARSAGEEQAGEGGGIARIAEIRRSKKSIDELAQEMEAGIKEGNVDAMKALLNEKVQLERSIRQYDFLAGVLKRYRVIHVTSSNIMFGALALHIVFALMYQVGN